jgi:hypothetical protein
VLQERFDRWRERRIEEIPCSVKRREKTGEIAYILGGDGAVMKEWEATNERGVA